MRSHWYEFGTACELTRGEILDGSFTHDGDSRLARHVGNARTTSRSGVVGIRKESPSSSKKIDAAVCMVGARMVRRRVLAKAAPKKVRTGAYIR
jgi:phage terminase large subunit-like protein